jgi:hypothetical protein
LIMITSKTDLPLTATDAIPSTNARPALGQIIQAWSLCNRCRAHGGMT